ncbi:MAG: Isoleucine-tRNA ligase [Parcubacteria group bacterium GW2011_GWA1_53_13]|nr:MAG: Isoleucine-tRNA ligase [Parcubacteria group bacterium GW2011_GWA1_53_13]
MFKEEKIKHSYPHCWRCDTPLLNWAATSWFVKVSSLKAKLLRENAKISWVPSYVGDARFANGLQSAPDWAISRSRYWGAPLPVWRNTKTKEVKIAGSVLDVLSMVRRSGNRYFVMRHGEANGNAANVLDPNGDPKNHLTQRGEQEVVHTAAELKREKIDMIIASPFLRTRETSALVQKELGLPDSALMLDERLHEYNEGDIMAVRRRVGEFLFEAERRYSNKNILIVSHGNPIWVLQRVAGRKTIGPFREEAMLRTGEARELPFTPYPHNRDYELDLHRPYIDEVPMGGAFSGEWKRVSEVFDCWFESGSMPYASNHYPFKKNSFNPKGFFGFNAKGYPADFIAEGLDQTRGWFYSLIVLGTALFGKSPYKQVIVNGLILAGDGQKMSKRLRNYPDPMEVVGKYGADALRYYLLSSPVIRGEDLRFQERGVDEVAKKLLMRLDNVRSFYDLYAPSKVAKEKVAGSHVLDRWILSRLAETVELSTKGFNIYELDAAARPVGDFIDDLSTWYVRRSRDRFKSEGEDKQNALATLRHTLKTIAQVMAPIMPFFAEDLYRRMRSDTDPVSVHLTDWPAAQEINAKLVADMARARAVSSLGLQAREKAGIKIRQPLQTLTAKALPDDAALRAIIADEVNVKEVVEDAALSEEVTLDTTLTSALKEEGALREWVRAIQDWRKTSKLSVADRPGLLIKTPDAEFIRRHREALMEATGLLSLETKEGDSLEFERL